MFKKATDLHTMSLVKIILITMKWYQNGTKSQRLSLKKREQAISDFLHDPSKVSANKRNNSSKRLKRGIGYLYIDFENEKMPSSTFEDKEGRINCIFWANS